MKRLLFIFLICGTCFLIPHSLSAQSGKLWGMTSKGGSPGLGVIFKTNPDGSGYSIEYEFQTPHPGSHPTLSHLTQTSGGKLYGVAATGGVNDSGVLFEYDPATNIYVKKIDFIGTNGSQPCGGLTLAPNGKLYGMTTSGGPGGAGTLYEYDPITNAHIIKKTFNGVTDGYNPRGVLTLAQNGKLYGMNYAGGLGFNAGGTIFEYDYATNVFTKKYNLPNGAGPYGSLTQAPNGKFYGMTKGGGIDGINPNGILFEYDAATNTFVEKHQFSGGNNGSTPWGTLLLASNGKFYGVAHRGGASDGGILFEYDPSTNAFIKKYDFYNTASTGYPTGDLAQLANGMILGSTADGGGNGANNGILYQFDPTSGTFDIKVVFPSTSGDNSFRYGNGLTLASNGKIYGMHSHGMISGAANSYRSGAIYEYDPVTEAYVKKIDMNLSSGSYPVGNLSEVNAKLYGTTSFGGAKELGVLFEFDPQTKVYQKKVDFTGSNGAAPRTGLLLASNGKLYGVTGSGGSFGIGTLFEYDPATQVFTKKVDFVGTNGSFPSGNLMQASNGKIYGITMLGGLNNEGVLFEYDPATSVFIKKYDMSTSNGSRATGALTEGAAGKLYAVTEMGGTSNGGVLLEYDIVTGVYSKKLDLNYAQRNGSLTYASNGKFYGVRITSEGVLYEYDVTTNTYTVKYSFGGPVRINGFFPTGSLTQSGNGKFYGTTVNGGTDNFGVLFEYDPVTNTYAKKLDFTAYNGSEPNGALLVTPKDIQTIFFGPMPAKNYSDAPFSPGSASSGLAVTYASSNPAVATTNGNSIQIVGVGTAVITASQSGNSAYHPAADVQQTLTVNKSALISTADNKTAIFGHLLPALTITYTGFKTGENDGVIDTSPSISTTASSLSPVGSYPISLTGGEDDHYTFTLVSGTLSIIKADQTITFNQLTDKLVGDPDFNLAATSTSGLAISYNSSDPSVAAVSGNTVTIIASGTTTITASQTGNTSYNAAPDVAQTLTVNKGPQSITFNALPVKIYDDAPFLLAASASSGLPVTYISSDPAVATISGSTVTITGVGETTITALQLGNTHWYAASDVPQTLTVNKANQSITFNALSAKIYGDVPFILTATSTSGLPVSFVSGDPAVATISGNTVTITGGGTTTITASQPGNTSYNAATDVAQTLTVNTASQSITFNALPTKNFGDAAFVISATATSGLPVVFASSDLAVATVSGNTITIVGGGTTTITASQPGNASYSAAANVLQTLTVNKINQTITFSTLAAKTFGNAPYTLAATTTSGLPITYTSSDPAILTISGNTVTIVGAGSATITASQSGNTNYNAAVDVVRMQTVNKANQTITFATPPTKTYTSPAFAFAGTVTSGLPITYAIVDPAVATVNGVTCTIAGVGATQVTASQPGNANFNAAAPVVRTLTVNKAAQTITFATISAKTFGGAPFTLTATTTSGLPISYSSSNSSVISVSGNVATIVGAGTATITASQAGDGNYNAATPIGRAVTVNKAAQTITFLTPPAKAYGDGPFTLTGTTTSGLTLTYVSSNTSVATVSGDQVTIVGVGTSNITASQAGDVNYNAATNVVRVLTVTKGNQVITFGPLTNVQYGDAPFSLSGTASSGLAVTYISSAPSVATVSGNVVTIVGVGTASITASQTGNTLYNAAPTVAQTLTVNKGSQSISFSPLPSVQYNDPSFALSASASSGLPVTYSSSNTSVATVSGNTITITGVGSTTITASQAGNGLYDAASSVPQTLTVNKDDQTITFSALPSKAFGDASFVVSATASSGLGVNLTSSNTAVATISGFTITIVGAGSTTITASQTGNTLYNAAPTVDQALTVTKIAQTMTFGSLADKVYGDPSFTVSATASSGLAVTFSSTNTAAATVSGNIVTIVGPGTATIVASQPGDANYDAAANVLQSFTITLPPPTEPASYVDIYNITSSGMSIEFFSGDGNKRMVIMKPTTPVNFTPVNNTAYALNYTVNGNVVVMNDAGSLVNVSGLLSDTKYFIKIVEYNEIGSFTSYMTTSATATARTAVGFSGFVASGAEQSSEEGELVVRVLNNPFKTRLSILIETPKEEEALVGLLDLNGKVIYSSTRKTKKQIDIEEPVVNGVYMLRVRTRSKSKMIRVVRMD